MAALEESVVTSNGSYEKSNDNAQTSMVLNGETRVFLIIGDPIGQVKSPALLTANMAARGINGVMIPAHVLPADVDLFLNAISLVRNVDGVVATIPHKQAMFHHCARLTERARYAGSANVMWREAGTWAGDNTDGQGYVDGIVAAGGIIEGRNVLLIGGGGAGAAIAFEFLDRGASALAIHDINIERRDALIARLAEKFPGKVSIGTTNPQGFDIIGNATPLGMREGDPLPVEAALLNGHEFVADVVTKPEISPLIAAARLKGCGTMPGLGMFKAQENVLVDALLGNGVRAAQS